MHKPSPSHTPSPTQPRTHPLPATPAHPPGTHAHATTTFPARPPSRHAPQPWPAETPRPLASLSAPPPRPPPRRPGCSAAARGRAAAPPSGPPPPRCRLPAGSSRLRGELQGELLGELWRELRRGPGGSKRGGIGWGGGTKCRAKGVRGAAARVWHPGLAACRAQPGRAATCLWPPWVGKQAVQHSR